MATFSDWDELLEYLLQGNVAAISFCQTLFDISQTWDDIVDRDNPELRSSDINKAFWDALITLPHNPFYREHFEFLQPLMQAAIVDWMDSNDMADAGDEPMLNASYVLRDSITNIVIHCARLVGGYAWMREVSFTVRSALYDESLGKFKEEHRGKRIEQQSKDH